MKGHGAKFGRKHEEAIAALLTQRTTEDAARAVGIGVSTLLRWMAEPEFKSAYLRARREVVHQAVARVQQATGAAGTVVLRLMTGPNVPRGYTFADVASKREDTRGLSLIKRLQRGRPTLQT